MQIAPTSPLATSTHGFRHIEILEVTGADSLTVKGDLRWMLNGDERFWIFAPPSVDAQTGAIRGTYTGATFKPAKCDSRYLWAQYRYMPPMAGYEVNPGTPGIYGKQPGTNQAGTYHTWNRQYDPGTGRWTTPDPAMSPWGNLWDYVNGLPMSIADVTGLDVLADYFGQEWADWIRSHSGGVGADSQLWCARVQEQRDLLLALQDSGRARADAQQAIWELNSLLLDKRCGHGDEGAVPGRYTSNTRHTSACGTSTEAPFGSGTAGHDAWKPRSDALPKAGANRPNIGNRVDVDFGGTPFAVGGGILIKRWDEFEPALRASSTGCIPSLGIIGHGGYTDESGGHRVKLKGMFWGDMTSTGTIVVDASGEAVPLQMITQALKGKMCDPCEITLDACLIGQDVNSRALQSMANETGCTVNANRGYGFIIGRNIPLRGYSKYSPK